MYDGTVSQIVAAILLALASIMLYSSTRPFKQDSDDHLMMVAQWEIFFVAFSSLLLKMETMPLIFEREDGYTRATFETMLFFVVFMVPVMLFFQVMYVLYSTRKANELADVALGTNHKSGRGNGGTIQRHQPSESSASVISAVTKLLVLRDKINREPRHSFHALIVHAHETGRMSSLEKAKAIANQAEQKRRKRIDSEKARQRDRLKVRVAQRKAHSEKGFKDAATESNPQQKAASERCLKDKLTAPNQDNELTRIFPCNSLSSAESMSEENPIDRVWDDVQASAVR